MYIGSVKFFKHLILTLVCVITAGLILTASVFGVLYFREKNRAEAVSASYKELKDQDTLNIPAQISDKELYDALQGRGYTSDKLFQLLRDNDPEAVNKLYRSLFPQAEAAEYVNLYPDLYAEPPKSFSVPEKTVYLTFDDGPSDSTLDILSILKKHDIKATFFMSGSDTEKGKAIMKQVADAGMAIGMHSRSHDYNKVYASMESYLEDLNNTYQNIKEATGVSPDMVRFPGGSINNYNRFLYKQVIAEVTRRGFVYYDWDVSGEDASKNATWKSIYNNVLEGVKQHSDTSVIVLLHDSKERTAMVVEDLIVELDKMGYSFAALNHEVTPTVFGYLSY